MFHVHWFFALPTAVTRPMLFFPRCISGNSFGNEAGGRGGWSNAAGHDHGAQCRHQGAKASADPGTRGAGGLCAVRFVDPDRCFLLAAIRLAICLIDRSLWNIALYLHQSVVIRIADLLKSNATLGSGLQGTRIPGPRSQGPGPGVKWSGGRGQGPRSESWKCKGSEGISDPGTQNKGSQGDTGPMTKAPTPRELQNIFTVLSKFPHKTW